jgi:hypothetical protein
LPPLDDTVKQAQPLDREHEQYEDRYNDTHADAGYE